MPRKRFDIPLTEQHFQALGRIAAQWGSLETLVDQTIWALLHIPCEHGKILTDEMSSMTTKLKILSALAECRLANTHALDHLRSILSEVNCVSGERHMLMHGVWGLNIGKGKVQVERTRFKRSKQMRSPSHINKTADRMSTATAELLDFMIGRLILPPSLPDTPLPPAWRAGPI